MIIMPDKITIQDKYGPAMEIKDQQLANEYLAVCVEHTMRQRNGLTLKEAMSIEKQNLGYFAGYYADETRERVERLFKTEHPVFGPIATARELTPEQVFEMGHQMGMEFDERGRISRGLVRERKGVE